MNLVGLLLFNLSCAAIQPAPDTPTLEWGNSTGYTVTGEGVTLSIDGPTTVRLQLFSRPVKSKRVTVELVRDEEAISINQLRLRPRRGRGPAGHRLQAVLGIKVPEGSHTYQIRTKAAELAMVADEVKQLPRRLMATAESELEREAEQQPDDATAQAQPPQAPGSAETATSREADLVARADSSTSEPTGAPEAVEVAIAQPEGQAAEATGTSGMEASKAAVTADASADEGEKSKDELQRGRRVAVYDLQTQDIASAIGTVVTDSLVAEVRKMQGLSVIGMDEIRDMLSHEANKQFLGCEDDSCLAEIAGALGVDDLITGKLSKAANGHVMVVRRIDQNKAKVLKVFNQRLKAGSGQEFLLAVGPAVESLYPNRYLRDGMQRGVAEEVALRLDPPPLPPWAFYATAGAAIIAAGAGGVFGLLANNAETRFNDIAGSAGVIDGSNLRDIEDTANSRAFSANLSYGIAGGFALSAAIMYLFTDWEGYRREIEQP